jgi:hypothetical protein
MHLIRLLLSAVTILREGFVPLRVGGHPERLLAIRAGAEPWETVETWRLQLHGELDKALESTALPSRRSRERVSHRGAPCRGLP